MSLVLALILMMSVNHVTSSVYLPFGLIHGDTPMSVDDESSPELSVDSFVFYEKSYTSIWVNVDGSITFTKSARFYNVFKDFNELTVPVICVFCTDVLPDFKNRTWYRISTLTSDSQAIQKLARQYEDFGASFTPSTILVVTWDRVAKQRGRQPNNTMQIVVATDGVTSLVLLDYDAIVWTDGRSFYPSVGTKVGFNKGDTKSFYLHPLSKSENLTQLPSTSNINEAGLFLYRVDQDPVPPAPTLILPTTT
ncbi:alpha-tectorin-like [Littorina saxatilis]|uniref:NIDO domain-containing protein n=1 Tax=Littorina saxatilis TaxID=31220 RepID=A0AAN9B5K2_9CAEN